MAKKAGYVHILGSEIFFWIFNAYKMQQMHMLDNASSAGAFIAGRHAFPSDLFVK